MEVEARRVAILAAVCARASGDPSCQTLALAALNQARISETELARWRDSVASLYASLEAGEHEDGEAPERSTPPTPALGRTKGQCKCGVGPAGWGTLNDRAPPSHRITLYE